MLRKQNPLPGSVGLQRIYCALIFCACSLALALFAQPASAARLEAGTFVSHDTINGSRTPARVTFQQPFDVVPVVIAIASSQGNNSATIRITNVTTTGFDELAIEPDNWDGRHIPMTIQYIAVEPGRHVLSDGTVIEAGFTNTTATQFGSGFTGGIASWQTVSFSAPLNSTPTVLHQILTANSEANNPAQTPSRPYITSIAQALSPSGFQLALDRSQANSGPFPSAETVGWIAFPAGSTGTFPDIADNSVTWSSVNTGANIRGWSDGCFTNGIGQTSASVVAVAKKVSRNNADGGWFRYCSLSSSTIGLRVDEDRDQDNERGVANGDSEQASIIAFSQPFHANLTPDLVTVKTLDSGDATPVGGDTVRFLITVNNIGNAPATNITLTDQIPTGLTATTNNGDVSQGSYDPGTGIWTLGTLDGSASATLEIEGTVDAGQGGNTITNNTTAAIGDQSDPSSVGDDLTESVTITPSADLSVTKTNTPGLNGEVDQTDDSVTSGSTTTYTVTVTNNGPDSISGAIVTDAPGAGISCPASNAVSITGSGVPSGSFTVADLTGSGITLGTLADGESTVLTFNCDVI